LIQVADIISCQEKVGFYLTAQGCAIEQEMLEKLSISEAQIEEVRAKLPDKLAEAEASLSP
jgi:hypothetical protein